MREPIQVMVTGRQGGRTTACIEWSDWKKWDVDSSLEFEMGPEIQAWKLIQLGYKPASITGFSENLQK